jgi:ureidoglycolate lyase
MTRPKLKVVELHPEVPTVDAFARFGSLLTQHKERPDFRDENSEGWKIAFDLDGSPQMLFLASAYRGASFSKMERHFAVTQTFIPVGRVPAVVAVAPPTDISNPSSIPSPEDVRAFVIDGSVGYVLHRATWHSLDRYPLYPATSQVVMITSRETQDELEQLPPSRWRLTQQVDYAELCQVTFVLRL